MGELDDLLDRLQEVVERLDGRGAAVTSDTVELLDGLEALHRHAVGRLVERVGRDRLELVAEEEPAVHWLLSTYAARDDPAAAEQALEDIRPYLHSHGGEVEVLDVREGNVLVRLSGSCAGCTASAITLQHGVEEALRDHMPGFRRLEVEEDEADPHAPPGPTLLEPQGDRRSLPIVPL